MTSRPQDLINDWYERIEFDRKAHLLSAQRLDQMYHTIGLFAVILGTIAGTTLLSETQSLLPRAIAGVLGLLAAVLSGILTFYSYARRAELHRVAEAQLSQIRRQIEGLEKLPPKYIMNQTEVFLHIGERLAIIKQTSPEIEKDILDEVRGNGDEFNKLLRKTKSRRLISSRFL